MDHPVLLIAIGALFLGGLGLEAFGRIVHVPRVTLLILLGALMGPPALDVLPHGLNGTHDAYAAVALTMVAFLLGGELTRKTLSAHGREILTISLAIVVTSMGIVAAGLMLIGVPAPLALILGAISAATAPASTRDVIRQSGIKSRFSTNILGVVAIDDLWGVLLFSLVLISVSTGHNAPDMSHALWEAGGAIMLGIIIGIPAALLTGRLKQGEPTLVEAVGLVFLTCGLALWLEVSFLLAGIVCGAVVVNLAKHHEQPFNEIERIEWPFLLLFFVMAGASFEVEQLHLIGATGAAYVLLRVVARLIGGWLGGTLSGLTPQESRLMGLALMPQAGVAIGMALVAGQRFPEFADTILVVTITSTIAFEIFGPALTQYALARAPNTEDKALTASAEKTEPARR